MHLLTGGKQIIRILWPDRWEIKTDNWQNHDGNMTYAEAEEVAPEISKGYWRNMRIQRATDADVKRSCRWTNCNNPLTVERKHYFSIGDNSKGNSINTFIKDEYLIREQFSAQTFECYHLECAIQKLQIIEQEIHSGLSDLRIFVNEKRTEEYNNQ